MDLERLDSKYLNNVAGGSNPYEDAFWVYVDPLIEKYEVPHWPALESKCTPEEWNTVLNLFKNYGH